MLFSFVLQVEKKMATYMNITFFHFLSFLFFFQRGFKVFGLFLHHSKP
jgi:hypothetical protein